MNTNSVPEKRKPERASDSYGSTSADGENGKEPLFTGGVAGIQSRKLICQQTPGFSHLAFRKSTAHLLSSPDHPTRHKCVQQTVGVSESYCQGSSRAYEISPHITGVESEPHSGAPVLQQWDGGIQVAPDSSPGIAPAARSFSWL